MPLISIVIPTLDSAATIGACLDSLAAQSCRDFEVLVQDGLSTDGTVPLVEAFRAGHPGLAIRLRRERDGGIYDAMNRALDQTRGEWVYFLGSDDRLFAPATLDTVSAALTGAFDVVYGNVESTLYGGRYAGRFSPGALGEVNISHQAIFVRRRLFDEFGRFETRFRVQADWEHNMRWFLAPHVRVRYLDAVIAEFGAAGISAAHHDPVFRREKPLWYVRHGRHVLPPRRKAGIVLREMHRAVRTADWPQFRLAAGSIPAVFAAAAPLVR